MLLFQTTLFFRKPLLIPFSAVLVLLTASCQEPPSPPETAEEVKLPAGTRSSTTISKEQADALTEKLEHAKTLKKAPSFPGGNEALATYLEANLKYPEQEKANGISENIFLNFNVEADGSITDVTNVTGVNQNLIDASITVVENMPNWEPGISQDGQPVTSSFMLPIAWTLKDAE